MHLPAVLVARTPETVMLCSCYSGIVGVPMLIFIRVFVCVPLSGAVLLLFVVVIARGKKGRKQTASNLTLSIMSGIEFRSKHRWMLRVRDHCRCCLFYLITAASTVCMHTHNKPVCRRKALDCMWRGHTRIIRVVLYTSSHEPHFILLMNKWNFTVYERGSTVVGRELLGRRESCF